jgi:hypothetical protein
MSNIDEKRERNGELKQIVVKFRLKVQISFVKQILKKISDIKKANVVTMHTERGSNL